MSRSRWMALCFALGSTCFLIGPFPGYAQLVGDSADADHLLHRLDPVHGRRRATELAGLVRTALPGGGGAAWWAAIIQSAGTLFFNVTTYQAMHTALTSPEYNKLVWRPDWRGSICFLVSGAIAYRASARHGWLPVRGGAGWWQPAVNLLGCVFFGISAVAGYVVPSTGSMLDQAAANWNTSLGRGVLPGLCARHLAHRQGLEDATGSAAPRARAQARGRRSVGDSREDGGRLPGLPPCVREFPRPAACVRKCHQNAAASLTRVLRVGSSRPAPGELSGKSLTTREDLLDLPVDVEAAHLVEVGRALSWQRDGQPAARASSRVPFWASASTTAA